MDKKSEDMTILALLKQFSYERLPKALELKEKVFAGHTLNKLDIVFLDTVFKDAQYIMRLVDKHPEYQELASKATKLYTDITEKALENEKAAANEKGKDNSSKKPF